MTGQADLPIQDQLPHQLTDEKWVTLGQRFQIFPKRFRKVHAGKNVLQMTHDVRSLQGRQGQTLEAALRAISAAKAPQDVGGTAM